MTNKRFATAVGAALLAVTAFGCGPKPGTTAEGTGPASKAVAPPAPAYSKTGQRMQAAPPGFPSAPGGAGAVPPPGPAAH